jgi:hypothetical protein
MLRDCDLRMHTHTTTGLALALIALLSAGCADQGTKQMVIKPKLGTSEAAGAAERRVVLFRAEVDVGGEPMEEPWSLHLDGLRLFTIVAPKDARLTSRHSFLPGRPDSASSDAGWGFLALPPGAYQLAFEGTAMRFVMDGAQDFSSEAVPVGRSPASTFVVPPDAASIYIGTFSFTCHEPSSRPDALKIECTALGIRNDAELARQIAQTALSKYGPMQEALASPPGAKPAR